MNGPDDGRYRLIHGECLAVMRGMEAGSVSAIVTDPPYGQSNESWDKGVDPAVWRECFRVAGPNAALISFAGSPTYHRIASDIEAAGWKVRQMWAWVYRDGMITSAWPKEGFDRLAPAMDPICFATKGKVLLRLGREGKPWGMKARSCKGPMSDRFRSPGLLEAAGRYPKSIVSDGAPPFEYFLASRQPRSESRNGHPNQKPLALMRWLVSKLPPGSTILDPYAGSATTLVAAQAEGHSAIGIEKDPAYFALAERRLAAEAARFPLLAAAP